MGREAGDMAIGMLLLRRGIDGVYKLSKLSCISFDGGIE